MRLSQFPCPCPDPWPPLSKDNSWWSQHPAEEVVETETLLLALLSHLPCPCPEPWPPLSDDDSWRSQHPAEEVEETESLAAAGPARGSHEAVAVPLSLHVTMARFEQGRPIQVLRN